VTGRIAGLDLLRGSAVGLVMLRHAVPSVFRGAGVVGVVMFWTLATEEQFYLLWPAALLLGGRRALGVAAVATSAACLATTWWLIDDPDRVAIPRWAVPAALTALTVLSVVPLRGHALTYLAGGPAIAALTGVLILAWRTWTTVTGPLSAFMWLGTVSYAAYLWDYPLSLWLPALPAVVLTLAAAAVSWRYVEAPQQRRRAVVAA
jgi:peptidoglycan/LPS O-acetylase OafA/YrhL